MTVVFSPLASSEPFIERCFEAFHSDPLLSEGRHGHKWRLRVYWPSQPMRDGRCVEQAVDAFLGGLAGLDLPVDLWATEAMAERILRIIGAGYIVEVELWREDGAGARARWQK